MALPVRIDPENPLVKKLPKPCLVFLYVLLAIAFTTFLILENLGKLAQTMSFLPKTAYNETPGAEWESNQTVH